MKKTLLLALATLFATVTFAQQQLATLNHNDSISVFYGANALVQAHAAAIHGDVITLSSGTFYPVNITKAITIKGNGMEEDTVAGTAPTIINGGMSLNIDDSSLHIVIEGVKITGAITPNNIYNPFFSKCIIGGISQYYSSDYMKNAIFVNCVINYLNLNGIENTSFYNSIILSYENNYFLSPSGTPYMKGCTLTNCIVRLKNTMISATFDNRPCFTCTNSILYFPMSSDYSYSYINNTVSCYNCIGISCNSDTSIVYFYNGNHQNTNFQNYNDVFKYFTGSYYSGISFELQDSIAENFLGNDGTPIGVYGGMVPFNPRVNTPRYVNCSVAPHTTLDGKLSVDIEVVSE